MRGSYPPLVTPFSGGEVDYDAFAELVDRHAREGSHGVVVCGTTGEPTALTIAERAQLLEVAIDASASRLPVIAATGAQSLVETIELSAQAEAAGASALLIVTPYFIKPPLRGLQAYYIDLAARTDLPVLIYNIPGRSAVSIDAETIARIVERAPNVAGVKHAATNLDFVTECLIKLGADFRIFVGLEELSLPMLALGASGMINAVANLLPRKVAQLWEEVNAGTLDGARHLHNQLFELSRALFYDTNPIPLKYMMKRIGLLTANEHRLPMLPATAEVAAKLDGVLERAGLL